MKKPKRRGRRSPLYVANPDPGGSPGGSASADVSSPAPGSASRPDAEAGPRRRAPKGPVAGPRADSPAVAAADSGARPFLLAMAVWLVLACVVGASGVIARLTPPLPQALIGALALGLILTGALHRGLRAWLARVNLRGFVAFHLTRFVGIVFLIMYQRGELAGEFAIAAGWGDIVTAAGALALVLFWPNPEARPWVLMLWNAFGLADILTVVITATRIALTTPEGIAPLLRFPMSLVPTFVVPVVIASHVLIFVRLRRLRLRDLDPGARGTGR